MAIVIMVVATYKKLRWCHQKRKIKEAEDLHKVVNVKNNRPLHVSYDIDRFEEVITERQVSALPVIDRLPTQAEPKAAVVFLDEPLAEAIIENPAPQAANHARARRHSL